MSDRQSDGTHPWWCRGLVQGQAGVCTADQADGQHRGPFAVVGYSGGSTELEVVQAVDGQPVLVVSHWHGQRTSVPALEWLLPVGHARRVVLSAFDVLVEAGEMTRQLGGRG